MKHKKLRFTIVVLGFYAWLLPATHVQGQETWESERINVNIAGTLAVPVGSTTHFVENNPGIIAGTGYNFSRRHAIIASLCGMGLSPRMKRFSRPGPETPQPYRINSKPNPCHNREHYTSILPALAGQRHRRQHQKAQAGEPHRDG